MSSTTCTHIYFAGINYFLNIISLNQAFTLMITGDITITDPLKSAAMRLRAM